LIIPRGLRADDAAAYLGMGKTKFLELVDKGTIPRAFTIDSISANKATAICAACS
jgi:predicted DNA-binding transcriptional regulator AlpA